MILFHLVQDITDDGRIQIRFHHPDAAQVRFAQLTDRSGCIVSLCCPQGDDINIAYNIEFFA